MRVLVTGWRYANPIHHGTIARQALITAVNGHPGPHTLIHGAANGWDILCHTIATTELDWTSEAHPANWTAPCQPTCLPGHRRRRPNGGGTYCPTAGNYRNQNMVNTGADVCVAAPGPGSTGTTDCIRRAKRAGIPVQPHPIDLPYRVLSIQQGWLHAILTLGKTIENRRWHTDYRGTLLLHAAAKYDPDAGAGLAAMGHYQPDNLPTSAILGVARLDDICAAAFQQRPCDCGPWAAPGQYHWRLTDIHAFERPVPARGALGLWFPGADLVAAVEPQLAQAGVGR
jgi:hypothetical protein